MICTEEEAKKKICKRTPVCTEVECSLTGQRRFYQTHEILCIASACMMWCWDLVPMTHGHCGLAERGK